MNFEKALTALKQGQKIIRQGWSGYEEYVILVNQPEQVDGIDVLPYFAIRVKGEGYAMFQPTVCDILAEDWELVHD